MRYISVVLIALDNCIWKPFETFFQAWSTTQGFEVFMHVLASILVNAYSITGKFIP